MATATAHPDFNLISSEDVEGTTVYDPSGNEIGKMDHLMIDKPSGQVRYAIMSFGGFSQHGLHGCSSQSKRRHQHGPQGLWRDKVFVERLWRSANTREVNLTSQWRRLAPQSAVIFTFYNSRRPHSRLDRQTPDQVYFNRLSQIAAA